MIEYSSTKGKVYEVIDTYVYRYGIQLGNYTFGTAVGLMKSVFGFFFSMADELHLRKSTGYENFLKKGVKAYEAYKEKELYC